MPRRRDVAVQTGLPPDDAEEVEVGCRARRGEVADPEGATCCSEGGGAATTRGDRSTSGDMDLEERPIVVEEDAADMSGMRRR